ncbi:MAG: DUF3604 domain-containing protein [Pseudomonadales bacterium]
MKLVLLVVCSALALIACNPTEQKQSEPSAPVTTAEPAVSAARAVRYTQPREPCEQYSEQRVALFGDVHVHTSFSFDASANSIGATPIDANNFAQGEAIPFWPLSEDGKPVGEYAIDRPLDFLAVTDHGEFLGERRLCMEAGSPSYETPFCARYRSDQRTGMVMLGQVITTETPERIQEICSEDGSLCRDFAKGPWQRMADAAAAANDVSSACEFTSFIAYEYTGTPGTSNYHRNVIFRNATVPDLPVSYIDAPYDSELWRQLDAACATEQGCDYLTIPHNSNLANGRMAPYMRLEDTQENRVAYARTRLQREPIMEVFQHKGNSECINGLGSVLGEPDELCEVEAVRHIGKLEEFSNRVGNGADIRMEAASEVTEECVQGAGENGMLGAGCVDATDYLRSGLLVGLAEENEIGLNPVKLGVIAATDTHAATPGAVSESDWRGHVAFETSAQQRVQPGLLTSNIDGNPGGLAGVWAMENSRDAIFEAMQRREVFGTTGPRIVPRFFAGWDYSSKLCDSPDLVSEGYANGVPMGGDLSSAPSASSKPVFIASVQRDAASDASSLQKLQLIKGWIRADGKKISEVIDIAGGNQAEQHDSLCAVYTDQSFDPTLSTYYYLRAVEHAVPRWSVHDCERLAEDKRPVVCTDGSYPTAIQEMAWTSPVWYQAP